ncbi:UNVERIFIED_CONTAM: hypothetical protein FKN15_013958 [Acipenser sinensis]
MKKEESPVVSQAAVAKKVAVSTSQEDSVGLRLAGGNDVGIFVGGVKPGSLASQQGIEEGDQILKVNGVDFGSFTREEAALYLLQIPKGEQVIIQAQSKLDIYRKMLQSNVGDSFYIRTHFDHEGEGPGTLSFTRGDVFRVLDTMHRGKLGTWRAVRMSNILQEADRGTIPNKSRAEQLASTELTQRSSGSSSSTPSSRLRAEFWKLRGLRGAKKSNRKSREDLSQLTIQGKFPPYEKVFLREATFKRPIVILGPLSDVAIQKLSTEMPAEFQTALMVPRNSEEGSSSVIKLETVRQISEQDRHPLLDITPSAVERLNYIQYHPMVLFLDPESRQDVKAMRQQLCPQSNKSSRRLYTQAVKMRKYCPHLFSGKRAFRFDQGRRELPLRSSLIRSWFYSRIPLLPDSNVWFEILKDRIKELQARPVWFSEDKAESGEEEEDLDALSRSRSTDYLSCDSRATSDYEDTDGEACTDNELDEAFEGPALGRSSEPALPQYSEPALARSSEPTWEEEDISHKPYRTHSYSAEPRVWVSAPGADRLTPELESAPPDLREVHEHRGVPNHPKPLSVLQEQPRKDASDSAPVLLEPPSCPGTPSPLSKLAAGTSSAGTLKRPTALSRHASAAGFPMQAAGTWGFSKGHRGALSYSPTAESGEGTIIEVEDIAQLLRHVARFAESVEKLKDVVLGEEKLEGRRPLAHECLGEVLRILRQVISMYPLLNTVETLTAAGTLISKVKGFHYESGIEADKKDFEKAIETIAVAFSSRAGRGSVLQLGEKLEGRRPLAHECLGEVLRILRQVISMYPLLNTVETLTAAGTLISKVKGFHYESGIEADKKDFEKAIETIAVAFSSR